eukprot:TRINITY_DN1747_c0_g1_i1.p2 TRINITY_DN1747_c0_g1~~TRINITY_DN1747_c0_g1_i1.p2  ORF type:complete len:181 (+),score=48.18 TRINITY_DN1747_c0_g1_i1:670-1212(+)
MQGMTCLCKMSYFVASHVRPLLHLASRFETYDRPAKVKKDFAELSQYDRHVVNTQPDIVDIFVRCGVDNLHNAPGVLDTQEHEYVLMTNDWGFSLADIVAVSHKEEAEYEGKEADEKRGKEESEGMRVCVWTGLDDGGCAYGMANFIANSIPGASRHFIKHKGHLMLFEVWDKLLWHILV